MAEAAMEDLLDHQQVVTKKDLTRVLDTLPQDKREVLIDADNKNTPRKTELERWLPEGDASHVLLGKLKKHIYELEEFTEHVVETIAEWKEKRHKMIEQQKTLFEKEKSVTSDEGDGIADGFVNDGKSSMYSDDVF